ncbi:hypothetical protein O9992_23695 [Vibrio lentus]|nr:hypothetical protein [Vibrio lentus]
MPTKFTNSELIKMIDGKKTTVSLSSLIFLSPPYLPLQAPESAYQDKVDYRSSMVGIRFVKTALNA